MPGNSEGDQRDYKVTARNIRRLLDLLVMKEEVEYVKRNKKRMSVEEREATRARIKKILEENLEKENKKGGNKK